MAFQIIKLIVERNLHREAPATGLGLFRIAFGLVALQEVLFLFYFRHLIFDVVPFIDRASPILHFFLLVSYFEKQPLRCLKAWPRFFDAVLASEIVVPVSFFHHIFWCYRTSRRTNRLLAILPMIEHIRTF